MDFNLVVAGSGAEANVLLAMLFDRQYDDHPRFETQKEGHLESSGLDFSDLNSIIVLDVNEDNVTPFSGLTYHKAAPERKVKEPVLLRDYLEGTIDKEKDLFVRAIGDQRLWVVARKKLEAAGLNQVSIIHQTAEVCPDVTFYSGVVVHHGAHIGTRSVVGSGTIINTHAIIEHDVAIGPDCFIGPGAVLCGAAKVGQGTFIGANVSVAPGMRIGSGCFMAIGAIIYRNVERGVKIYPAQRLPDGPTYSRTLKRNGVYGDVGTKDED